MHLNELNHRNPLRVFERSVHGGLGRGNLGLVAARTGVGKSGFLTTVAIDDLLRGRKVLHVTTTQTVDHVRDFYDEIFSDLARAANLEERAVARRQMEANRIIESFGAALDAKKLAAALEVLRAEASFSPDLIIVDGYDFDRAPREELERLRAVAGQAGAELWMSIRTPRWEPADWHDLPAQVARVADLASVVVLLQAAQDGVRIRLLKDHDHASVAELELDLDPRTFLVKPA